MKVLTNVRNVKKLKNLIPEIKEVYVLTHAEEDIVKDGRVGIKFIPLCADNVDYNDEVLKDIEKIVLNPGHKDAMVLMALSGFGIAIPVQFVYEEDNELYLNEHTYDKLVGLHTALTPYLTACIKLGINLAKNQVLDPNVISDKVIARFYEEFDNMNNLWKELEDEVSKHGKKLVEEKLNKYF